MAVNPNNFLKEYLDPIKESGEGTFAYNPNLEYEDTAGLFGSVLQKAQQFVNSANKLGTDVYSGAGRAYENVDKTVFKGSLPYGSDYVKPSRSIPAIFNNVLDKGLIPVPTTDRNTWAAATGVKAYAGPLGKPFRVMDNPDAAKYRYETLGYAQPSNNDINYGLSTTGKYRQGYEKLRDEPANMAIGQYSATPDRFGFVNVTDNYNTNNPLSWYFNKVVEGSPSEKGFYAVAGAGKALENIGWLNQRPLGSSVPMGFVNPTNRDN